ncbi:hypothetical protein [Dubosiella newyorkensis]|uniref:hypothetical protein n=1 Tax=Dubosiella newyorkensis TaxID=1862672 RepID=UPI003F67A7D1
MERDYILDTEKMYFDCTNYYFEIDREDNWEKERVLQENRKIPYRMGLLLDSKLHPHRNASSIRETSTKSLFCGRSSEPSGTGQHHRHDRPIAEQRTECPANIHDALSSGTLSLFESVKMLPEKEKTWALLDQGWTEVRAEKGKLAIAAKVRSDNICLQLFRKTQTEKQKEWFTFRRQEKRIVTYNPSWPKTARRDRENGIPKPPCCCLSKAQKGEYGESPNMWIS